MDTHPTIDLSKPGDVMICILAGTAIIAIFIYVYMRYAKRVTKENSIPLDMLLTANSYYHFNYIKRYMLRIYTVKTEEEFNLFNWSEAKSEFIKNNEEGLRTLIAATKVNQQKLVAYQKIISDIPDHSEKSFGLIPKFLYNCIERRMFYENVQQPAVSFKIKLVLRLIDENDKEQKRMSRDFGYDEIQFPEEKDDKL